MILFRLTGQAALPGGREPAALGQLVQGRRGGGGGAPAAPPAALPAAGRPAARRRADRRRRGQLHLRRPQRVRLHQEDLPGRGPRIPGKKEAVHLAFWFGARFQAPTTDCSSCVSPVLDFRSCGTLTNCHS